MPTRTLTEFALLGAFIALTVLLTVSAVTSGRVHLPPPTHCEDCGPGQP